MAQLSEMDSNKVFVLQRDVANPRPDRRTTDWNRLPVWEKGSRICCHTTSSGGVLLHRSGGYSHMGIRSHEGKAFNALVDAMFQVLPTAAEHLAFRHFGNGSLLLDDMLEQGLLTYGHLTASMDRVEARWEAEAKAAEEAAASKEGVQG